MGDDVDSNGHNSEFVVDFSELVEGEGGTHDGGDICDDVVGSGEGDISGSCDGNSDRTGRESGRWSILLLTVVVPSLIEKPLLSGGGRASLGNSPAAGGVASVHCDGSGMTGTIVKFGALFILGFRV